MTGRELSLRLVGESGFNPTREHGVRATHPVSIGVRPMDAPNTSKLAAFADDPLAPRAHEDSPMSHAEPLSLPSSEIAASRINPPVSRVS